MPVKNYNPKLVTVVFKGIPISGFADGSFISVSRDEDSFGLTIGTDGEGCRYKTNNFSGTITLTLGQWSSSNDLLSAILAADELAPIDLGTGPFLMKDLSGSTLVAAATAWIVKPPDTEYAREPTNREWQLKSDLIAMVIGGN